MIKIDRTQAPALGEIKKLNFPPIVTTTLANGIDVSEVVGCSQPVCNISFVIKRGAYVAKEVFIASATANLLSEGTINHPGNKLPELLDYYGITVSPNATLYDTRITLRTLSKHIKVAIELLAEMILTPEFSEENFQVEIDQSSEGLKIANERVNYLAQKEFLKLLFGRHHKYGRLNSIDSLKKVTLADIKSFHKENYKPGYFKIYLSGDIPNNAVELLNSAFSFIESTPTEETHYESIEPVVEHYSYITKRDAKQSAIFMGKSLVAHNHADFPSLYFLNVVLGGYFGSRLMTKLREEMGVTYGVSSYIIPRKGGSDLYISSEVKAEATEEARHAVIEVIKTLQEKEISNDELINVRSYIMGNIANLFDSSFAVTNQLLTLEYAGSNLDSFNRIIDEAKNITPKTIQETAIKYFDTTEFVCAIAGR